jgi:uncharacterized membrane protein
MSLLAFFTTERDWPWRDEDLLGWPGLAAVAAVLVLLTLWTYSGQRKIGWGKVATVLGLRLAALAVVALLLLRPAFASEERVTSSGKLIVVLDSSLSMKIMDGPNNSPRWDVVRKLLEWPEVKEALDRLQRERQIEVVFYQADTDVRKYDPASEADGKRTDIGQWLHALLAQHRSDKNLRGVLLLTDGGDNGTRYLAVEEAAQFRGLGCPVHTFAVGLETTREGQNDIAVVDVKTDQQRYYVKNEIKVKAIINAPGFVGSKVTVRLLAEGKEVGKKDNVTLQNARGNEVDVGVVVAEVVGELKVTVKVDEMAGEFTKDNNELSTFVTVDKKGLSVLWAEGRPRLEATWALRAIKKDQRIQLFDQYVFGRQRSKEQKELFTTPETTYDVVVLGDLTAEQLSGGDALMLERIANQVRSRRTGLVMLGGFKSFGNSDWQKLGKPLADLLPAELGDGEQTEQKFFVTPDPANKGHRLLQLGGPPGKDLWTEVFKELPGMAKFGKPQPGAEVLARAGAGGDPILVVGREDGPRTAVFAGDTTYAAWTANDDAVKAHERFWSQLIQWLARQEKGDNYLWVKLDKRRLAAGANDKVGFSVGMQGRDGGPAVAPQFVVTVTGPGGEQFDVKVRQQGGEYRGEFDKANVAGEYRLQVKGTGKGKDGVEFAVGPVPARFVAVARDVENLEPAADYKYLDRLAAAGGGSARMAVKQDLLQYLAELESRTSSAGFVRREAWPNWRYTPADEGPTAQVVALVASGMLPCLVLFVGCVSAEWFLRRWWGLV